MIFFLVCCSSIRLVYGQHMELQVDNERELEWDNTVIRGILPNGFAYFIRQNNKPEKRVEIRLVVRAGAILEEDNEYGIAHFTEHMAFNGTENFPPGELVKYFERFGAEFGPDSNAYTSIDHTVYILHIPTEEEPIDKALTWMADCAAGMLFLPDEVEKEKGVILEEERLYRSVEMRILEKGAKIALKGTKYPGRIKVLGTPETIKALKTEDFKKFYNKWYRPDRMAIVVVGDIDVSDMERRIKEKFEALKALEEEEMLPVYPAPEHNEIWTGIITDKELPAGGGGILMTRPPRHILTIEDFRKNLLETIAIDICNSRLSEITLTPKDPPFKQASAMKVSNMFPITAFEIIAIYSYADMKKELIGLQAIIREIERISRFGVTDEEIKETIAEMDERYRNAIKEKEKRESSYYVQKLVNNFLFKDVVTDVEYRYSIFKKLKETIKTEEVQTAAKELFRLQNATALLVLPEYMKGLYKEKDIIKAIEDVQKEQITAYKREEKKKATDYTKLVPGKILKTEKFDKIGVTRITYESGLRVLFKPTNFQEDEILISTFSPGGNLIESGENKGITRLMSSCWISGGTEEFNAIEIERLQKGKTISIYSSSGHNPSLQAQTINKDFEETLQWMFDYITAPAFREEAVEQAKKQIIDELKDFELRQDSYFYQIQKETECPNNQSSYLPSEEDIKRITSHNLKEFNKTTYVPSRTEITIVGNINLDTAIPLVSKYLGSIRESDRKVVQIPENEVTCKMPSGYTRRMVYKGGEERTKIVIEFPIPIEPLSPDLPAMSILSKVVDMRLLEVIREEFGGTYYIYASSIIPTYLKGRSRLQIGFATDPDKIESFIKKIYEVLEKIKSDGPSIDEIQRAKEVYNKDFEENLKENSYWADILDGADIVGIPLNYYLELHRKVQEVSAEKVKEVAKKYIGKNKIELIALPEE